MQTNHFCVRKDLLSNYLNLSNYLSRDHSDEDNCQSHIHWTSKRMYDFFIFIWLFWNFFCKWQIWEKLKSLSFFLSVAAALADMQKCYTLILSNRKTLFKVKNKTTKLKQVYLEGCQAFKMERVFLLFNSFSQNAPS